MSKVAEAYYEHLSAKLTPESVLYNEYKTGEVDYSELSEKERCRLLGVACSFGICDECDAERS